MTVTAKSKHALAPLFRRTSIRNPLTIERQMVCFSFPILCSELLPSSLYLTSDRITALNPAERQSSRFYALPLRRVSRDNSSTMEPAFLTYARSEPLPVLHLSCKR